MEFINHFKENEKDIYDIHGYLCSDGYELRIYKNNKKQYYSGNTLAYVFLNLGREIGVTSYSHHDIGEEHIYIPKIFCSLYWSDEEMSLDECQKTFISQMYGGLNVVGRNIGYSEWTVLGCDVSKMTVGGHDILKELKSHQNQFVHFIIEKEGEKV